MAHGKNLSTEVAADPGEPVSDYYVAFSEQEDGGIDEYCGAASVQMILGSIGANFFLQTELYEKIQCLGEIDPDVSWFSSPEGIVRVLNTLKPDSFSRNFEILGFETEPEASRAICWKIECGVAPIVSLSGGNHWVVVAGYEASQKPTAIDDHGYDIVQFDLFDPANRFPNLGYERPASPNAKYYWKDVISAVPLGKWKHQFLVICSSD